MPGLRLAWSPIAGAPSIQIAFTRGVACALAATGGVACWSGDSALAGGPAIVPDVAGAVELHAAAGAFCAARIDGSVWCWDADPHPQAARELLGPGSVEGAFTGARDGCAIRRDQLATCWGDNRYGRLGDGTRDAADDGMFQVPGL